MWNDAHDTYLEERVLSAGPVELIRLLYEGSITAVLDARRHLAAGDIAARSQAISRACDIVMELNGSLDRERGGEIAANLARVYDYVLGRLMEANLKSDDALLGEVAELLSTLADGWSQSLPATEPEPAPTPAAWSPAPFVDAGMAGASHAWSL